MSDKNYFSPNEILAISIQTGINKTKLTIKKQVLLGILAGGFIALAGFASNMAAFNLLSKAESFGLGKLVSGVIFPAGLILVIIAGGELFTGNCLIVASVLDRKVRILKMLQNWLFVYLGNFIGALFVVFLCFYSGQLGSANSLLAGVTIKIAFTKIALSFAKAFYLGILCNWLVCLGVWLSYAATDVSGKILACFFPVMLFVISGFEHSIANMYYIPAGIFAKNVNAFIVSSGIPAEALKALNWQNFVLKNLVPVTLGNIVGGGFFVATMYWLAYSKNSKPIN